MFVAAVLFVGACRRAAKELTEEGAGAEEVGGRGAVSSGEG